MLPHIQIEKIIRTALNEDLAAGGDITSAVTIPAGTQITATINARQDGILAGLIPALTAFTLVDASLDLQIHNEDGGLLSAGEPIITVTGDAKSIMQAERTALNILSHLSGIASATAIYVHEVQNTKAKICDTRKTLPGLRALQKYAVQMGGGSPHRYGLGDAILIKDNHIAIAGGIEAALGNAKSNAGHTHKIEIEVDTLGQLNEVLSHGGADIVMLDNFTLDDLKEAVKRIDGKLISEASGGVTFENVKQIAETGVDYISIGALTHSVKALDIGLDIAA